MEKKQTNRITMYKTVAAYLDERQSIWNSMAPMATAVQQFKDKISAIDTAAQKQTTATAGVTEDKAAARDALEDVLFLTGEALTALGHAAGDHNLTALSDSSSSALHELGDEELSNRATSLLAEANGRKTALATMQVTQANLDELDQALQDFNAAKANPRTATAERMAQTESLSTLLRETSGILRNQIDRMMNLFRRSNPEFVAGYRGARVIVDRAAGHTTKAVGSTTPPAGN